MVRFRPAFIMVHGIKHMYSMVKVLSERVSEYEWNLNINIFYWSRIIQLPFESSFFFYHLLILFHIFSLFCYCCCSRYIIYTRDVNGKCIPPNVPHAILFIVTFILLFLFDLSLGVEIYFWANPNCGDVIHQRLRSLVDDVTAAVGTRERWVCRLLLEFRIISV